jgi:adenylate cyclase
VISYETYAFVRDIVVAQALAPITMKGISREVIPYAVSGILDPGNKGIRVFSEHLTGADFYLNANMIEASDAMHLRKILQDALKALEDTSLDK